MYCKKCGKQIADDSVFCSYCGASVEQVANNESDKNKEGSNVSSSKKSKKTIYIIASIIILVIGFFVLNGVIQKQRADREMERMIEEIAAEVKHKYSFVGTYENNMTGSGHIKLELNGDNTAVMYLGDDKYSRVRTYRGHWEESYQDILTISFTSSFDMFGSKYNTTVYFNDNALWESLTAIRAKDYRKAEYLSKLNTEEKKDKEQTTTTNTSSQSEQIKKFKDMGYNSVVEGSALLYKELHEGNGRTIKVDDKAIVNYEMRNAADSTLIDEGKEIELSPISVISGLKNAMIHMKVGSTWSIYIPNEMAFGGRETGDIKPYTNLLMTVTIKSLKK